MVGLASIHKKLGVSILIKVTAIFFTDDAGLYMPLTKFKDKCKVLNQVHHPA